MALTDLGIGSIVEKRVRQHLEHGDLPLIGDTQEAIESAVDQWFTGSGQELADRVGPVYGAEDAHRLLDRDRRIVASKRDRHTILGLRTRDGDWVYPAFQFSGRSVDKRFVPFFKEFAKAVATPWWDVAVWFRTPNERLDNLTPVEVIKSDGDVEAAVQEARRVVKRWNR